MAIQLTPDPGAPSAAVEIAITKPLLDYDIEEVERESPREVDEILVTLGFRDLIDDARSVLEGLLEGSGLNLVQLTGAITPGDTGVFHPGLWFAVVEAAAPPGFPMSRKALERVSTIAVELVHRLRLR